jgi:hypothetical protein
MEVTRTHPAPTPPDFHCALLWLRSMEIAIGCSPVLMLSELEMDDLFARYRSPWRA